MSSLAQNKPNEINSFSKNNSNSDIYSNNKSSEIYSSKNCENIEFHKIHSFPLIINKGRKDIIELNEVVKGKYLNVYFNTMGLYLSKNKEELYNFFKFILDKTIYKLKIKINEKNEINSIYLIYINPKTNINQKEILIINKNNSINTKDSSSIFSLPKGKINNIDNKNINNNNGNNKNINFYYARNNFCNYIPNEKEMRKTAEKIPCHFPIECYQGINQIHNNIGNKEFLNLSENNIFSMNNDSYKNIDKKDHLFLNHLCLKFNNKSIINSFIFKYRHKNATFIYYK